MIAVADSTPLIALGQVDRLSLLMALFDEVFVPESVYREVVLEGSGRPGSVSVEAAEWLIVREPAQKAPFPTSLLGLGQGETDAILLALETGADWVLLDEKLGRRTAKMLGLQVKGTLGILLAAYYAQHLSTAEAQTIIDLLARSDVRVSDRLVAWFKTQLD